ncbi:MAG: hypothetical protein K5686_03790 [Lachnospiraceae bacterium]|nr:hypothetical protein [Lachnospiraceae bacterium]
MGDFRSLPEVSGGIMLMFVTLILFMYIWQFIRIISLGKGKLSLLLSGVPLVISYVLFQLMTKIQWDEPVPPIPMPTVGLCLGLILLAAFSLWIHIETNRWQERHISAMSVKEAFDRLPAGLLFYVESGVPLMVNEMMHSVSRDISGMPLRDGEAFYKMLKEKGQETGDQIMVRGESGKVYSIKKSRLLIKGAEVAELTAVDISREYELTEELKKKQDKVRLLNNRLKALLASVEYVSMNRELLQLKTALHDNIGQSILIARRYLSAPGSVDKKRMLDFWGENIKHLVNDEPEEWELPYYVISKEADRLGIKLNIIGELPDEQELIPVVDAAISVHIGNTLKHADGRVATVSVQREAGRIELCFTNDGKQPEEEIVEMGGLLNLRKEVESVGGSMELISRPAFELKISLPGEEE